MDLQSASPEQIAAFHKGAEARYAERKVAPPVAQQLYVAFMGKVAKEMGFVSPDTAARVDATATKIAASLGRKRPEAAKA